MKGVSVVLATIAWVCGMGFLEGCASHNGRPGATTQLAPSQVRALEQVARPEQDGTILLRMPTWLADVQLKPGRYEFQQRVDRGEPLLHVIEVKRYAQFKRKPSISKRVVAEAQCGVEALGQTAAGTRVHIRSEAAVARVDWIALAGEDSRCFPKVEQR